MPDALLVLVDLALVVVAARCVGALAVRLGEPRIAGEMIGAILVGPTVLGGQIAGVVDGAIAGGAVGALFPAPGVDVLTVVGAVGMILYMLLVGMTIDAAPIARRIGPIVLMALAVVAASSAVAVAAGLWLGSDGGWRGPDATMLAFALALSAALAAQGVPIAARILEERGLLRSEIGATVIAIGATVTTLALIISGVAIRGADAAAVAELALIVAAGAVVVAIAAPLGHSRWMALSPRVAVVALVVIALGAGAGGKAVLGTVLLGPLIVGVAVRSAGFSAAFLEAHLGSLVRGVLLPVFLGVAALHANLRELLHADVLPQALAVIAAIVLAKTAAGMAGARAAGFGPVEARVLGALVQCGGVMTIAVSLDLLHAGLVTTRTHALLTLVGLVTTLLAGPLLARSGCGRARRRRAPRSPPVSRESGRARLERGSLVRLAQVGERRGGDRHDRHRDEDPDDARRDAAGGEREDDGDRMDLDRAAHDDRVEDVALDLLDGDDEAEHDERLDDAAADERDEHGREARAERADERDERAEERQQHEGRNERDAEDSSPVPTIVASATPTSTRPRT